MSDPYTILGVSPTATDEEIKEAYRRLAKKYHPDLNSDKENAERKMKEINSAYDTIKKIRENPGSSSNTNSNNYSSYGYNYSYSNGYSSGNDNYKVVEQYIILRNFYAAKTILAGISNRDAKWYYYSSIVNFGLGERDLAKSQIQTACSMNPTNQNYQNIKEQMNANNYYSNAQYNNTSYNPFRFIGWFFRFILFLGFLRFILLFFINCTIGR